MSGVAPPRGKGAPPLSLHPGCLMDVEIMRSLSKLTAPFVFFFNCLELQLATRISNASPSLLQPLPQAHHQRHPRRVLISPLPSPQSVTPVGIAATEIAAIPFVAGLVVVGVFVSFVLIKRGQLCSTSAKDSKEESIAAESTRSQKVARIRGFPSPSAATTTGRSSPWSYYGFSPRRSPPAPGPGKAAPAWNLEDENLVAENRYSKLYRVAMSQAGQGVAMKQVDRIFLVQHCSPVHMCASLAVLTAQVAEVHRNLMWPAGFVLQGRNSLVLLYREMQMANGSLRNLLRRGCKCEMLAEGGAGSKPVEKEGNPTLLRSYESLLDETLTKCLLKVSSRPYSAGIHVDRLLSPPVQPLPTLTKGVRPPVLDHHLVTVEEEKMLDDRDCYGSSTTGSLRSEASVPADNQVQVRLKNDTDAAGQYLRRMAEAYAKKGRAQSGSETDSSVGSWLETGVTMATIDKPQPPGSGEPCSTVPLEKSEASPTEPSANHSLSGSGSSESSSRWEFGTPDHRRLQEELARTKNREGSISHHEVCNVLSWGRRFQIALGLARGLAYLHHDCSPPIVHVDITSNNVCIDDTFEAMLGDAELGKLLNPTKSILPDSSLAHVSGSVGYIPPEYEATKLVTCKSNVYSFGVVLLELLTGRQADEDFGQGHNDLVSWVRANAGSHAQYHDVVVIFDARITADTRSVRHMLSVLRIAMKCVDPLSIRRPVMSAVVEIMERSDAKGMLYS